MKREVIVGVIVGILVPIILAVLSTMLGWLPKTSDYRIPRGTIAAFNLTEAPPGWKVYERAQGRFIIGVGSAPKGPAYALEQIGGVDAYRLLPDIFEGKTASLNDGGNNYLRANSNTPGVFDGRPPFVSLLICIKD